LTNSLLGLAEENKRLKEDVKRWKENFEACYREMYKREQKLEKMKEWSTQHFINSSLKDEALKKILGVNI